MKRNQKPLVHINFLLTSLHLLCDFITACRGKRLETVNHDWNTAFFA